MSINMRLIRESDLEQIMNWRMSPAVTKYMNTDPVLTIEGQYLWLDKIRNDNSCRYWVIDVDGKSIGLLGLYDIDYINSRVTWTWYIGDPNYRGKGIAKTIQLNLYDYVFNTLGLNRLYSEILAYNVHEIERVHKPLGYKVEGVMREHVRKNGNYYDVVVMAIVASDWTKIRSDYQYDAITFENDINKEVG